MTLTAAGVPAPSRIPALALVIAGLAVLALAVAPWDHAWSAWARSWSGPARPLADDAVSVVRVFGRGDIAVMAALALGALGWRRRACEILVALLVLAVVVNAAKWGVMRPRPNLSPGWSFPSGDAATAAALFLGCWARAWGRSLWLLLPTLAVAYGRCHDGYHYPSDVCAGCATGAGAVLLARHLLAGRVRWLGSRTFLAALVAMALVDLGVRCAHDGSGRDAGLFLTIYAPVVSLLLSLRWWRALAWRRRTRIGMPGPLLVGLSALAVLLWLSTATSLWDRDEPRFATASLEMARSGQWLVPTLNGEPRLHKPAGIYWLMGPLLALFGPQAWVARLPAMAAALAIIACCARLGRRIAGPASGATAAAASSLIIASCPLLLVCGGAATTDAVLTALITIAMTVLAGRLPLGAVEPQELASVPPVTTLPWSSCLAVAAAVAGALLVKGPLGELPALILLCTWPLARGRLRGAGSFWLRLGAACLGGFLLFACWGLPALYATDGAFFTEGVGKHVIARGAEAMEGHSGPLWYYLPVLVATFFPWTALLPLAIAWLWRAPPLARALLIAWTVPTFLIFSCFATKLPHYLLPIFPALALMVGLMVAGRADGVVAPSERALLLAGRWLLAVPALALAAGLALVPFAVLLPPALLGRHGETALIPLHHLPHLLGATLGAALVLAAMVALGDRALARGQLRRAVSVLGLGMLVLIAALLLRALPAFEALKPSPAIAREVRARTPAGTRVWVVDYDEPSLLFALDRGRVDLLSEAQVAVWAQERAPGVVIMPAASAARAGRALAGLRQLDDPVVGLDVANGHWVELVAFARGLP